MYPYGMIEKDEYNKYEKLIDKALPNIIVFEYFKHYKQMSIDVWNTLWRPHIISRDTSIEKQFGNLPFKHKIFPEFGYGTLVVIELKKKSSILKGQTVYIRTNSGKLKGFIAFNWEDDKFTCFEVI